MKSAHYRREPRGIRAVLVGRVFAGATHPVDVGASTERLANRSQHQNPDVAPRRQVAYALRQFGNHQLVERVLDLLPVQVNCRDATSIDTALDGLVVASKLNGHSSNLSKFRRDERTNI